MFDKDFLATAILLIQFLFNFFWCSRTILIGKIEIICLKFFCIHLLHVLSDTHFLLKRNKSFLSLREHFFNWKANRIQCLTWLLHHVVFTFKVCEIMSSNKISICSSFFIKVGTTNFQNSEKKILIIKLQLINSERSELICRPIRCTTLLPPFSYKWL